MRFVRSLSVALCALALCAASAVAQTLPAYFTTNNNAGTEFFLTFLPAWPVPGGTNNIKIYVSSAVETEVTVEIKSEGWIKTKKTRPNDIIEFILPVTIAQPYFKIDRDPSPPEKIYRQHAVQVTSKDPVIVYGMTRYQYTSDGFLALPTSSLGKDYVISSYADIGDNGTSAGQYLPSETAIVAAFDNTKVVFTLGGTATSRTSGGMEPGQSKTFTMNQGDVLLVSSFGRYADLSGSRVTSSKPVGVISGNYCAYVPVDKAACDHIVEMEMPAHTWDTEYVVTKIFGRQQNSYIKVVAAKPNTSVYCDGVKIGEIDEYGGVEGTGYLHLRISDGPTKSHVITADNPISVTQFNPGQQDDNVASDPFQLVLTPSSQYTTGLVFNTPGIGDGQGFARNYANIVFELNDEGAMPEDLEIGTMDGGEILWRSVATSYGSLFEELQQSGDTKYGVKTLALPSDGVYHLRSSKKFTAYLYGFNDYDSYGYPAGALMADRTRTDIEAPIPTYSRKTDGSVSDGLVVDPGDAEWRSNLAKVSMIHAGSFNYSFTYNDFVPGEDHSTRWELTLEVATQPARAELLFVDRMGNDTIIVIEHGIATGVDDPQPVVTTSLWPQPAVDAATLEFSMDAGAHVHLALYNELGEEEGVLLSEVRQAGIHKVNIGTASLSAGVYLYRLTIGAEVVTGRLVVTK